MLVWLVTIGEPLPVQEGAKDRPHRTGLFARLLAERGNDVVWWTSTYDHFRKKHLFAEDHVLSLNSRLEIRLLHGCGYRSNLSLARFRDHRQVADRFAAAARAESRRPDIIVAALPTIELCLESTRYGRQYGVPVVLDMRDMWPDVFLELLPRPLRPLGYLPLASLFRKSRAACRDATAITGMTDAYVDWGLKLGGRRRSPLDRSFHFGYVPTQPLAEELAAAEVFWDQHAIPATADDFNAVFFGNFGRQFNLEPIIEAARRLAATNRRIRFVLCGSGDRLEHYKSLAAGLTNIVFPGWVGRAEIFALMRRAAIGLAPYRQSLNFTMNIANKPAEYFCGGLPIALSLKNGVLHDLLRDRDCGFSYADNPDTLVRELCRLQDDPALRKRLSENARALFEQSFVAEKVYGRMAAYLEEIATTTKDAP
jgi:glycosyltransferase involved in cell wall biosynthesis